jgi:hypothetical protein
VLCPDLFEGKIFLFIVLVNPFAINPETLQYYLTVAFLTLLVISFASIFGIKISKLTG